MQDAAPNGREQRVGPGREQQQRRVGRGFLESLEEHIGGREVHAVDLVQDRDLARGDGGRDLQLGDQLACGIG
jgi:hypothetical protein